MIGEKWSLDDPGKVEVSTDTGRPMQHKTTVFNQESLTQELLLGP